MIDGPTPSRFRYIGRGMVAGVLGGGTAAAVAMAGWSLLGTLVQPPDGGITALLTALLTSPGMALSGASLTAPIWCPIGLAAGAGLGHIVGSRRVDRRVVLSTALLGALLVASLPAMLRMQAMAVISAVVGGLTGGAVAALAYGRLTAGLPRQTAEERQRSDAAHARWPAPPLVRVLVGIGLPLLVVDALFFVPLSPWLPYVVPLLLLIGWTLNAADAYRWSRDEPPWASPRRWVLAVFGTLVVVVLLTGLSAATLVVVSEREVQPPIAIDGSSDSTVLFGRGWPKWWAADVGLKDSSRGWEYRPEAHSQNATLWTTLVALSLLIEPVVGSVVRWRRSRA